MLIFHGSDLVIEQPKILHTGYAKDFSKGFYCTAIVKQAERWAKRRAEQNKTQPVINVYSYTSSNLLSVKSFEAMDDEWLDFIASCRSGYPHNYDVVIGPMANDVVWNYVNDFLGGTISREAFWALAKFKYPTHQIVFCTDNALSCLQFKEAYVL